MKKVSDEQKKKLLLNIYGYREEEDQNGIYYEKLVALEEVEQYITHKITVDEINTFNKPEELKGFLQTNNNDIYTKFLVEVFDE